MNNLIANYERNLTEWFDVVNFGSIEEISSDTPAAD
ncbi:hypothetical protein ABID46_001121 [Moheibacter stercoris]|uniref:Uncharacterized protein n=1 Tax=Moheibacter stercoris TaxID=1628251 RepID=A0ABV2LVH5_9FLAO